MRYFGLIGLALALAIAGLLVSRQIRGGTVPGPSHAASGATVPGAAVSGRQLEQDVRRSLDEAMRKARPMPEEP
jgi:hypothetical protein